VKFSSTGISRSIITEIATYSDWMSTDYHAWTLFQDPLPSCTLPPKECAERWKSISSRSSAYWGTLVAGNGHDLNETEESEGKWAWQIANQYKIEGDEVSWFLCKKPNVPELCGGCNVTVGRFALITFSLDLERRDICGNGGAGLYKTRVKSAEQLVTTVLSAIPIQTFNSYDGTYFSIVTDDTIQN
jgi:hypothetical protein